VYGWLWRRLPGGRLAKAAGSLLLAAITVILLFRFAFPYVEPRLPWNRSNVGSSSSVPADDPVPSPSSPPAPSPSESAP